MFLLFFIIKLLQNAVIFFFFLLKSPRPEAIPSGRYLYDNV